MMGIETIKMLENKAARKAAKEKKRPYMPYDENEIRSYGENGVTFPFPNIGSYRPEGWTLVDEVMCDKTGLGAEWEPALTTDQLKKKLLHDYAQEETYGYAIISEGQFQIVLGVFEQEGLE
jgi:hypothetical protein